ncbi:glycosyltransferase family 4 protein [Polynucleobacter sp. MWH-UH24A]|uniref:glycosyltransferase family 4 protein n=1 Tax=Polynucleobacter sp. MWH-UH24A TaxID=2689110 RepID=UPI001BFDCC7B|nr:glycosyltransferase family 4 protein [Polynucleobacter sp. MWH-UH24A]QWD76438.1 glycosyltransferase family 4 protein [Polynucleobacter sp. MWH-UH24A]
MRIVFLTQWFDPEPTFKGIVFAHELLRRDFEVEVITGFPNYPGGKLYKGYRIKLLQKDFIDGIQITRLPLYPNHDQSVIRRVLNYISFAASALFYGLFILKRADVMYAYHPPLTVGIVASIIRFFRGIPVVYDIQDMWPDTLRASGMINSPGTINLISKVCNWVYHNVDYIVVLSPGFKRLLIERGVPQNKIDVIYNWANEKALVYREAVLPNNFPDESAFKIVFAGNMGKAQGLDAVLEAAALLKLANSRAVFVMIGGGLDVSRLQCRAAEMLLNNVVFFPTVSMEKVSNYLFSADLLLVHLKKDPLFRITIPSKTQAYMCVGKPLLMAVEGDASELVSKSNGGIVVQSDSPRELAQAIARLASLDKCELTRMGEQAQQYYSEHLSLEIGVSKFVKIFRKFQ